MQLDRRVALGIKHPHTDTDDADKKLSFLNASRGLANLIEHVPFALFNVYLCREIGAAPRVAGAALIGYSVSRMAYTATYAKDGPEGRMPSFLASVACSMLALGVPIATVVRQAFN